jgi:hypothetical protein
MADLEDASISQAAASAPATGSLAPEVASFGLTEPTARGFLSRRRGKSDTATTTNVRSNHHGATATSHGSPLTSSLADCTATGIAANSEVFSTDWPLGAGQDKCGRDDGADSLRTQPNAV